MIERTLARRYATALLAQAERAKAVEEMEAQLLALKAAFTGDARLRSALTHPKVGRSQKVKMLNAVFKDRTPPAFSAFLTLLIRKNRLKFIPEIADAFDRLADSTRGVVRVDVVSFMPLTDAQRQGLTAKLTKLLGGKSIELRVDVDPKALGGLSVRVGDTIIDGTARARLKNLREALDRSARLAVKLGG